MKHSTTNVLIYAIAILICLATTQAQEKIFQEKKWEYSYKDNNGLSFINAIIIPGDTSVLVTDDKLGTFELYLMTGKRIKDYTGKIKGGMAFSPDGKYLYTYNFEKVEWPSGKIVASTAHPNSTIFDTPSQTNDFITLNFKTNRMVALGWMADEWHPANWIRGIRVYDLKDMKLIDTLGETNTGVSFVRVSDDGKYLAARAMKFIEWVATPDHSYRPELVEKVLLYDMETLKLIPENDPRYKISTYLRVNNTAYSNDEKLIYYTGGGNLYAIDSKTFEVKNKINILEGSLGLDKTQVFLSPDNNYAILNVAGPYQIPSYSYLVDIDKRTPLYTFQGLSSSQLHFVNNNKNILSIGVGKIILLNTPLSDSSYVSIKEELKGIFPNPFKDNIIIPSSNFKQGNLTLSLYDAKGEKIIDLYNDNYNCEDELKFNLAPIPAGIYFITSFQNGITKTMKIVKE